MNGSTVKFLKRARRLIPEMHGLTDRQVRRIWSRMSSVERGRFRAGVEEAARTLEARNECAEPERTRTTSSAQSPLIQERTL